MAWCNACKHHALVFTFKEDILLCLQPQGGFIREKGSIPFKNSLETILSKLAFDGVASNM